MKRILNLFAIILCCGLVAACSKSKNNDPKAGAPNTTTDGKGIALTVTSGTDIKILLKVAGSDVTLSGVKEAYAENKTSYTVTEGTTQVLIGGNPTSLTIGKSSNISVVDLSKQSNPSLKKLTLQEKSGVGTVIATGAQALESIASNGNYDLKVEGLNGLPNLERINLQGGAHGLDLTNLPALKVVFVKQAGTLQYVKVNQTPKLQELIVVNSGSQVNSPLQTIEIAGAPELPNGTITGSNIRGLFLRGLDGTTVTTVETLSIKNTGITAFASNPSGVSPENYIYATKEGGIKSFKSLVLTGNQNLKSVSLSGFDLSRLENVDITSNPLLTEAVITALINELPTKTTTATFKADKLTDAQKASLTAKGWTAK